jgi:crossover junction endodeoxyribonuclease RuvC
VLVLGIDPGSTGALAFLNIMDGVPVDLEIVDMPTRPVGRRSHLDAPALVRKIEARGCGVDAPIAAAILEQGGVRPQNGRVGAASFWVGVGEIRGVLAALHIRLETVAPATWKRAMRVSGDKGASLLRASEAFPRWSGQWARKKDHGRAEAALIALYGVNRLPAQLLREIA